MVAIQEFFRAPLLRLTQKRSQREENFETAHFQKTAPKIVWVPPFDPNKAQIERTKLQDGPLPQQGPKREERFQTTLFQKYPLKLVWLPLFDTERKAKTSKLRKVCPLSGKTFRTWETTAQREAKFGSSWSTCRDDPPPPELSNVLQKA